MKIGAQYYANVAKPDRSAGYQLRIALALLYPKR
jgi:hypothetical protein